MKQNNLPPKKRRMQHNLSLLLGLLQAVSIMHLMQSALDNSIDKSIVPQVECHNRSCLLSIPAASTTSVRVLLIMAGLQLVKFENIYREYCRVHLARMVVE